jgi:tripartite-type tricarboxylate transporter receptor subunit TctC
MSTHLHLGRVSLALVFGLGVAAHGAAQVGAAELYEGKTVKVMIGYGAGGGYDTYGRFVARNIGRHLPGKPSTITQNMPGAGSIAVVNYIYKQGAKNGTEFAIFARSAPILALAGKSKQARFDPLKLTWVGSSSSYKGEAYMMMVRKDTGITSINDLRKAKKELRFAATSFGSDGTDVPIVLREVLGLNIVPLRGYPGGNSLYLAVERGEAQGRMTGFASMKTAQPGWLKPDAPVRPILQFATQTRLPEFPDVPTAREIATKADDLALIEMLEAPFYMARPFAAPPDLPAEITKALRTGFMKAHQDPVALKEAKKLRLDLSPADGAEVHKVIERLAAMPKSLYDRYNDILKDPKSPIRQVKWQIVEGELSKIAKKGRVELVSGGKTHKVRVTGGYTELTIKGKAAKDKALKTGMTCKVWYEGNGSAAGKMECK